MFDGAFPNHFATPPWLEQAPCCVAAFDHVLSPHRAVAVFGMRISFFSLVAGFAAAFCAVTVAGTARAHARSNVRIESVRRILSLQSGQTG
jgi:hypothetical protein